MAVCLLNTSCSLKWVPWLWTKKAFRDLLKTWKIDGALVQVEDGPSNLAREHFCQYGLHIYFISFHIVLLFIMGIIHLLHAVMWLPVSLVILAAGAAGPMTQHTPKAGKLQWAKSSRNESPFISSLHKYVTTQVSCLNLSTFKQNHLPELVMDPSCRWIL